MDKIIRNNCMWKELRVKRIKIGIKIKINKIKISKINKIKIKIKKIKINKIINY
jgi:hypothetical protein